MAKKRKAPKRKRSQTKSARSNRRAVGPLAVIPGGHIIVDNGLNIQKPGSVTVRSNGMVCWLISNDWRNSINVKIDNFKDGQGNAVKPVKFLGNKSDTDVAPADFSALIGKVIHKPKGANGDFLTYDITIVDKQTARKYDPDLEVLPPPGRLKDRLQLLFGSKITFL